MRRLFYPGVLADEIQITGDDAAHLMYAMRSKSGDEVTVVDAEGNVARMAMVSFDKAAVDLRLVESLGSGAADTESQLRLTLFPCVLKGEKMDWVVQKAVELGVQRIVPVISHNVVVKFTEKTRVAKAARWQKIATEAAKQCGRTRLPEVGGVRHLDDVLSALSADSQTTLLFCYEREEQCDMHHALAEAQSVAVLIGPEGGFTEAEAEGIAMAGGRSVTLGPRILRAETASVVALSLVQYEKGDLGTGGIR